MAFICHFIFLCPAQSLPWVYLVWVQLFRCRSLALKRMFSYIRGRYVWVVNLVSIHPLYIHMPLYVCIPPYIHMPPYICTPPYICMSPYPLVHLYVLPVPYVPHMLWGLGGHLYTPYVLGPLGASVYLSGILLSVGTSICLSDHNSHASCFPSLWVTSLLDWMPMDVCYASCCCSFLCIFHYVPSFYYHGYDDYCSSDCCMFMYILSFLNKYHGPHLDGASSNIRSAWCGTAATTDTNVLWRCCWPCYCAIVATCISDASSGLCQLCHGSSTGRFLFQSWASCWFVFLYVWCLLWCMLSAFRCHAGYHMHLLGSTNGVCTIATPWSLPMAGICTTWQWVSAHTRYALSGCSLHCFE